MTEGDKAGEGEVAAEARSYFDEAAACFAQDSVEQTGDPLGEHGDEAEGDGDGVGGRGNSVNAWPMVTRPNQTMTGPATSRGMKRRTKGRTPVRQMAKVTRPLRIE